MEEKKNSNYLRFFAMIGTSMVAMFILMYAHSYQIIDHFWFSETRLFMTLIMGGAMIVIMLLYMIKMYSNRMINALILIGGVLLLVASIWLVRSQVTVSGVDYMEGMIPHHSIAILTSERAMIEDVRVRELADKIIIAQRREIKEMEWLINDIRKNGLVETEEGKEKRPVPEFKGSTEKETKETKDHPASTKSTDKTGDVKYNPPKPEEAPEEIRQVVMYGYDILTNTKKHLPDYVGNQLNCHNCHFEDGITMGGKNGGISYVGVAAKYPKYRNRQDYSVDLMIQSFTDGAGMSKLETLASFAYHNMPMHDPILSKEQALDVAAYVTVQPRPKFKKDDKPW